MHKVSEEVEKATKPLQFALRTRAGCECVSHVLRTLAEGTVNFVPQGEGREQGDPSFSASGTPRLVCGGGEVTFDDVQSQAAQSGQWTFTLYWKKKCGGTPRSDSTSGQQ